MVLYGGTWLCTLWIPLTQSKSGSFTSTFSYKQGDWAPIENCGTLDSLERFVHSLPRYFIQFFFFKYGAANIAQFLWLRNSFPKERELKRSEDQEAYLNIYNIYFWILPPSMWSMIKTSPWVTKSVWYPREEFILV